MDHEKLHGQRLPNKKALHTIKQTAVSLPLIKVKQQFLQIHTHKPPWVERGESIGCNCN